MRKLIFVLLFWVYIQAPATEKNTYPLVSTIYSELMDSVVSVIKRTDLRKVYSLTGLGKDKNRNPTDYIYDLILCQRNPKTGMYEYPPIELNEQTFLADSSNVFIITGSIRIHALYAYIFRIKDLLFYSNKFLKGYFLMIIGNTEKECVFDFVGYGWIFKTEHGKIIEAYAFYSMSENPFKIIDLIKNEVVNREDVRLFNELYR